MVKIAVLSDVHGNATALEAVLADAQKQHVDEYWTVGDMTVRGPESERCLTLLDRVHPTAYVLGNHEENYQKVMAANPNTFTKPKQIMATVHHDQYADQTHNTHQHNGSAGLQSAIVCNDESGNGEQLGTADG